MSEIPADIDRREERIQQSIAPAIDNRIHISPLSHNKFLARWTMRRGSLDTGLQTASRFKDEAHLVLRAYSLPANSDRSDFSSIWNDYIIDGIDNSAYFTLPTSAAKIKAVIGVMNKSGHFIPLLRSEAVILPDPPPAPPPNKEICPAMAVYKASGN